MTLTMSEVRILYRPQIMKILSIETSCDETALSVLEIKETTRQKSFKILSNNIASQIELHRQYGGVFPMMAKREHSKNIFPLFIKTLKEAKLLKISKPQILKNSKKLEKLLERELELLEYFLKEMPKIKKPEIDAIAVTRGPGLEPALWVGINFAQALSLIWNIPIIPVNHMEGHIFSVLVPDLVNKKITRSSEGSQPDTRNFFINSIEFPALSLLVSGGHTELILMKDFLKYKKIGQTRDDAAGEAFDKVARMLGLPYPGGPEISRLAEKARIDVLRSIAQRGGASIAISQQRDMRAEQNINPGVINLPRPMLNTKDFDFSFSGLKTAVLYLIKKIPDLNDKIKAEIAREFEDATVEVLVSKTLKAIKKYKIKTFIVAGGVAANKRLKKTFEEKIDKKETDLLFPTKELSTDNSVMIALAGYFQYLNKKRPFGSARGKIKAQGNLEL